MTVKVEGMAQLNKNLTDLQDSIFGKEVKRMLW